MKVPNILAAAITVVSFVSIAPCHADSPPTVVLRGRFVVPRGAKVKNLRARVQTRSATEAAADCDIAEETWSCRVPAERLDIELYSPGLAPAYFWDVDAAATSAVDLGTVTFAYGAPITGKVVEHGYGSKGVAVELVPSGALTGDSALRSRLKSRHGLTDRAGNYTFSDVPSGTYTLVASKEGYSTFTRTNVRVEAGPGQKLARITIAALAKLSVYVTPPVDFYGNPWQAKLNRGVRSTAYEQLLRAGRFSLAGDWSASLLDTGTYRLEVFTSRGELVASRHVDVDGAASVDVHIDSVPIQGQLRVAGQPVKGVVSLIWEDGSSLSFRTSAEGEFTGIVTHEGSWRATVRTASPRMELHLSNIQVRRSDDEQTATVRIDLPAGQIHGSAVDEDEQPVHASVTLVQGGELIATTATAADGTFAFAGIENGPSQLNAMAKGSSSGSTAIIVDDDHSSAIKLVLKSMEAIRGHVFDSEGNPVLGAVIHYEAAGQSAGRTISGLSGDFSVPVPKSGGATEIVVIAPGLPRKFMTLQSPQAGDEPFDLRITLGGSTSARLDVNMPNGAPPWPAITSGGILLVPLPSLFLPRTEGPPAELRDGHYSFDVEPGTYTLCGGQNLSSHCVTKTIVPTGSVTFTNTKGQDWQ